MNLSFFILGLIVGYVLIIFHEYMFDVIHKRTKKEPILRLKGFHLHHSLYGVALIITFFIISNLFILGAGLGIIIRHTQDEKKLTFIDRS